MDWTADRDEPGKVASGVLAVVVHIAFFALLVLGLSWQHRAPSTVEVDLWSNLPPVPQTKTPPPPKIEPKPEVKPPPPPPPQPKIEAKPAPEPKPVAKPDIALEKEKQEKARREREQQEKEREKERQKAEALKREQVEKAEAKKREEVRQREEAEKQKLAALERDRREKQEQIARMKREQEETIARLQQQQASAQAKMMDEYRRRIGDKIRRYVVKEPCAPLGDPVIVFEAVLLPDGNTLQPPRIKRSSGSAACDEAVLRAVIRAQPLPLPPDPALLAQFRELSLNFRPNE
jgi:colicin import membrane protein